MAMKSKLNITLMISIIISVFLVGCGSPQKKAARSQKKVADAELTIKKERLKMIDEYKQCIADADDDAMAAENCDRILRAIEALQ